MTLTTLGKYLLGNGEAISKIAASRYVVWLGLLFVLSAGFAREYDGEDLLREPWHLGLPLVASLGTSLLLFALLWTIVRGESRTETSFLGGYRAFLGLYWMTAPLAWLYAIPVERFLSAGDSVRANLYLLGIVSLWRVFLMIRVTMVLFGARWLGAVMPVMLFADSVALVLLYLTPLPVFSIMGGIRLTEAEQIIQSTAFTVGFLGVVTYPIWLLGTFVGTGSLERTFPAPSAESRVAPALWGLAALSLLAWIPILPFTQREQRLRSEAERLLHGGRVAEAVAFLSAHERDAFPPHWDPPPRPGYGQTEPRSLDLVEATLSSGAKPWVQSVFLEKVQNESGLYYAPQHFWEQLDEAQFDRYLALLERVPANSEILVEQRDALLRQAGEHSRRTTRQKDRIRALFGEPKDAPGRLDDVGMDQARPDEPPALRPADDSATLVECRKLLRETRAMYEKLLPAEREENSWIGSHLVALLAMAGDYEQAIPAAEALPNEKVRQRAFDSLADIRLAQGEFAEAEALAAKGTESSAFLCTLSAALVDGGAIEQAFAVVERIADPDCREAQYLAMVTLLSENAERRADAEKAYQRAREIRTATDEHDPDAVSAFAIADRRLGRMDRWRAGIAAIIDAKPAGSEDWSWIDAIQALAEDAGAAGEVETAIELLRQLPESAKFEREWSFEEIGRNRLEAGDVAGVSILIESRIVEFPSNVLQADLSTFHSASGDFADARRIIDEMEDGGLRSRAVVDLAVALHAAGRKMDAADHLEWAAIIDNENAARLHRLRGLVRCERRDEARELATELANKLGAMEQHDFGFDVFSLIEIARLDAENGDKPQALERIEGAWRMLVERREHRSFGHYFANATHEVVQAAYENDAAEFVLALAEETENPSDRLLLLKTLLERMAREGRHEEALESTERVQEIPARIELRLAVAHGILERERRYVPSRPAGLYFW